MQLGINKSVTLSDGKTINIETGKLAKQADGSVVVTVGDTMLLAAVVAERCKRRYGFYASYGGLQRKFFFNRLNPRRVFEKRSTSFRS